MRKSLTFTLFFIFLAVLAVLLGNPFYIVKEGTQAVITRFGEPVSGAITRTGLHVKLPFVEVINRFERRLLEWDGDPNQIPTKDKRFIWIDTTARWRIADPLKFLQTVGNEIGAQARLDDILDSATRDVITEQPLIEIIRSSNRELEQHVTEEGKEVSRLIKLQEIQHGRNALTREILARSQKLTPIYGVELVDLRLKRVIYIDDVLEKIYDRMISERKRAAEQFRSEGQGRRAEVEGRTERDLNAIQSEAYRKAQEVKGKADAESTRIYAQAHNQDPEFYRFLKTLNTYESTVDKQTTLVLTTDSDYFKFLKNIKAE